MKSFLLIVLFSVFISACYSTRGHYQQPQVLVDPQVQLWLLKAHKNPHKKLAITVRSYTLLNYSFLNPINEKIYTGQVTKEQLQILLHDKNVQRIRMGKKKLHK